MVMASALVFLGYMAAVRKRHVAILGRGRTERSTKPIFLDEALLMINAARARGDIAAVSGGWKACR